MYRGGWMARWGLEGRDDRWIVGRCARGHWQTGQCQHMEKHRRTRDCRWKNTGIW